MCSGLGKKSFSPEAVVSGKEPLMIIGAIAGG